MKGLLYAGAFMLALLGPSVTPPAPPAILRTGGTHVVNPATGDCRWLGPGGHAAWLGNHGPLLAESHRSPVTAAPTGPLFTIDIDSRRVQSMGRANDQLAGVKLSASGRHFAALEATGSGGEAAVTVRRTNNHESVGASVPVGSMKARRRQAYAWLAGEETLVWVVDGQPDQAGLWQWTLPDGKPTRVIALEQPDGVWPGPDRQQMAIRRHGEVILVRRDQPTEVPKAVWAAQADVDIGSIGWDADGQGLWLHTLSKGESWVRHRTLNGGTEQPWPVRGEVVSYLSWQPGRAAYLVRVDGRVLLQQIELADGRVHDVAVIDPAVPLRPDETWAAPAPAWSPDGKLVAVSLGRTDRWGTSDRDKLETTDTDVTGATVKVVRRVRNVGPSGVVFAGRAMQYAGRARPRTDSPVVGDTRPGTFRWSRPSPPRWVVLHHTATTSDRVSVNSLTGSAEGHIARSYEDITPGSWIKNEPNTIGVHYLVLRQGMVLQLAEEKYITRHAGTGQWRNTGAIYDFNSETIGIEIVAKGNDFTPGQVRNVGRLVADICLRNHIPLRHVEGEAFAPGVLYHKDFAGGLRGKPDPAGWPWSTMMQYAQAWVAKK